jgi:hypothetical protein
VKWQKINTRVEFRYLIETVGNFQVTSQEQMAMRRKLGILTFAKY